MRVVGPGIQRSAAPRARGRQGGRDGPRHPHGQPSFHRRSCLLFIGAPVRVIDVSHAVRVVRPLANRTVCVIVIRVAWGIRAPANTPPPTPDEKTIDL
ncbi:hypothetical protein GCM10010361_32020 [Streptomyces olivaceiscleroticus]|uniref:Uncharacterized protein n=1 Tax=Streptomyces olivaceiscleroticus TaxID=68245 RepID=A0ABN1A1W7_9ACTN